MHSFIILTLHVHTQTWFPLICLALKACKCLDTYQFFYISKEHFNLLIKWFEVNAVFWMELCLSAYNKMLSILNLRVRPQFTVSWGHIKAPTALHRPTSQAILIYSFTAASSLVSHDRKAHLCSTEGLSVSFPWISQPSAPLSGMWWLIVLLGKHTVVAWRTYRKVESTLSRSTPCLAGLGWSDCRGQTACHKMHKWSILFCHTATCMGGQGVGQWGENSAKTKWEDQSGGRWEKYNNR